MCCAQSEEGRPGGYGIFQVAALYHMTDYEATVFCPPSDL